MIDPKNVNKSIVMSADEFKKIAAQGERGPLVNVVEIEHEGWAIFGPFGVFESPDGTRVFSDQAEVHKRLSELGIRRFVQGGQLKEF